VATGDGVDVEVGRAVVAAVVGVCDVPPVALVRGVAVAVDGAALAGVAIVGATACPGDVA
jgi:hypothetical protein